MANSHRPAESPRFQVEYTDEARLQLSRLEHRTCTSVQEKLEVIAAVDPYAHGHTDPSADHRDRRILNVGMVVLIFWISPHVKTITVVSIREGDHVRNLYIAPVPASSLESLPREGEAGSTQYEVKEDVK